MSFASQSLRRAATQGPKLARKFSSTKPSSGGHGDEPHYVHATHMYEIDKIKNKRLKFGVATVVLVGSGFLIPAFAVKYQLKKAAG